MADYLNQYPQLFYTLALVELKVYKLDPNNESLIVIPQVVMRTKEILRTVIKIETGDIGNVAVTVSTDIGNDGNESSMGKRYTISEDEYFHQLEQNTNDKTVSVAKKILLECAQKKFEIEWGQGSFSPKLILPDVNGYISLFIVDRKGRIYLGFSRDQFEKLKLDPAISNDYAKRTAALMNTEVSLKNPHSWTNYQLLVDLLPVFPEFMLEVDRYVKNINSAIESKSIVPEKH